MGRRLRRTGTRALAVVCVLRALYAAASPASEGVSHVAPLDSVLAEPGAALHTAIEALEGGERHLADALLRAIAERHAIIADHADLLRMRLAVELEEYERAVGFETVWADRQTPLRERFYTLLGRAHAALRDERRARGSWEVASLATRDRERLAPLELAIAESYLRDGAGTRAGERLLTIWTRYADLPEAESAGTLLDSLERSLGSTLRTSGQRRKRGDQLYRRRRNEAALAAYDRALAEGLAGVDRRRAQEQRAQTLFRLRRYPEAIRAFGALPESDERSIQRARARARAGEVTRGAKELESLGARRRGIHAVQATYLAALLWEGEGETQRARKLFASVVDRAPSSSYAGAARWRLGWEAYRAGRLVEAEAHFAELAGNETDPLAALRPRYWRIRAAEQHGAPDAVARYAELAREYPLSYYGWRALVRAGAALEERPPPRVASGLSALGPAALARPRILLEAGLIEEARDELTALFRKARGVEDRLALAQLYSDAGDWNRAQRLVVDAYEKHLAQGPDPGHLELWWHAWPAPFDDALRRVTADGAPTRELVYAIMREESGYRPQVISVSGARGLLQLMPETARRVAKSVALQQFEPDDLFLPDVNIQLGTAYLGQLLARFGGRTSAAIGSYNAGPEAVARWLRGSPVPDDIWVDEIPYGQTRGYVKRVLRSLHAYRVLY